MTLSYFARVQQLVESAMDLPEAERASYLQRATGDKSALRDEAERILAAWDSSVDWEQVVGSAALKALAGNTLQAGDRVGNWVIVTLLGQGGMGTVYRAERADSFQQQAALKVVRPGPVAPEQLVRRFQSERQILATISHANIARLLDGGLTQDGLPYLVMEFVDGVALDVYLQRQTLPEAAKLKLFLQICGAVQYAHSALIVHRDLKPSNILISEHGQPKLLDFGIAKLLENSAGSQNGETELAGKLMTPDYASPEQMRGEPITTATDIYSLGVLLYEVLTGTRPFRLANLSPFEMERRLRETAPEPPSARILRQAGSRMPARSWLQLRWPRLVRLRRSHDLDRIVLKCMHREPARRYSTVSGIAADMERYLNGFPVAARPDALAYRAELFVRRHLLGVTAALLFCCGLLATSTVALVQRSRARHEAASAEQVSGFLQGLFRQVRPDSTHGHDVSARALLDTGTEQLLHNPVPDPLVQARLLSTVGGVYFDLGAMDRALTLLGMAEHIQDEHARQVPLELATTEQTLGRFEVDRNPAEAERHLRRALALFQAEEGPGGTHTAAVLDALGVVAISSGHFREAQDLLEQSVRTHTKLFGPDAEETLVDKHNLASAYAHAEDYRREEPLLEEVLAAHLRQNGPEQEITTSDYGNLAWLEERLGHLRRAEALAQQTIELKTKLMGSNNPRLAMQMLVLGNVQRQTGQLSAAQKTLERGLAMAGGFEGVDSLHAAWFHDELGMLALAGQNLRQAEVELNRALRIRIAAFPQPLQEVAASYQHLGQLAAVRGDFAAAEADLRHAMSLDQQAFGRPTPSLAEAQMALAGVLTQEGCGAEACSLYLSAKTVAMDAFRDLKHPIAIAADRGLANSKCPAR